MSDIVERLRRGHYNADLVTVGGVTHDGRCLVAADEIARLRAANAALELERDALREALERIDRVVTYPACMSINPRGYGVRTLSEDDGAALVAEIARAALKGASNA